MVKFLKSNLAVVIAVFIISVVYWFGIASVPFHPDESTQVYMSADFKTLFIRPTDLFWQPASADDLRMFYREIDPPLTRYLIGSSITITGQAAPEQDWDWSKSWPENQATGALLSVNVLLISRMGVAFLFPFSLFLAYLIGKNLKSSALGWLNMGLLAINPLVLIHTRRAMAESALLFGILLTLWGTISWRRQRFWLAIPAALAFNAKYSALPLALIGLTAVFWNFSGQQTPIRKKLLHGLIYAALFVAVTWLLNPFMWSAPVSAVRHAFEKRQELISQQSQVFGSVSSTAVLDTLNEKFNGLFAQLYFAPPAIEDVANYSVDLKQASLEYTNNPLHNFLRGWVAGSIILFLSLLGLTLWIFLLFRTKPLSRSSILILTALLLQWAAIFIMIKFPFQRYYIPLIPYVTLLVSISVLTASNLMIYKQVRD